MVLLCGLNWYLVIPTTVHDQRRYGHLPKDVAERPLIGIEEVSCVRNAQHESVEETHVWGSFPQEPQRRELHAVDRVVDVIVPGQLHFLNTNRGEHRQRPNAVRRRVREIQRDAAAHTESHHVSTLDAELIQELSHVDGVRAEGVVRQGPARVAEPREIGDDDPLVLRQNRRESIEIVLPARAAVNQHNRGRRLTSRRSVVPVCDANATRGQTRAVNRRRDDDAIERARVRGCVTRRPDDERGPEQQSIDDAQQRATTPGTGVHRGEWDLDADARPAVTQ